MGGQATRYVIKPLRHERNVWSPLLLVLFIPSLAQELTANTIITIINDFTLIVHQTDWLQMENRICWSRKVISSAISSALSVEMFESEGTNGGRISSSRFSLLLPASSFFRSRRSCVAALCSVGSRLELQTMSSRKTVVRYLSLEPSKSWSCSCY